MESKINFCVVCDEEKFNLIKFLSKIISIKKFLATLTKKI